MSDPLVTIVVVPREQFSKARASLQSIRAATDAAYSLVYVDGNSPRPLARQLEADAERGRLTLVRRDEYLPSNVARNIGLRYVHTRYVVFLDNDVLVWPGWLGALVRCAEETGAWVVGPLYCIGGPRSDIVHTAGAELAILDGAQGRSLHERHHHTGRRAAEVRAKVGRESLDEVEFHCLLARVQVFERLGSLDEALLSFFDHIDLCLAVRGAGARVYTECIATVTYLPPPPLAWSDIPFFLLRWSDAWYEASLHHFCRKWQLDPRDPVFQNHVEYRLAHRARLLTRSRRFNRVLELTLGRLLERTVVRRLERPRAGREAGERAGA